MRSLGIKIKPANGFSYALHLGLTLLLPLALFLLVRVHFIQLAFILILLSKWRMFAVRPRFWLANIRANSVDMIVGFSVLLLMMHIDSALWQLVAALLYGVWLVAVKPGSSILMTSIQAGIGFFAGLMAIFHSGAAAGPLYLMVLLVGLVCFLTARHFFDSFEEPYAKFLAYLWGYFGAALVWVLGHWLLFYGVISQPTVLLVALGYGLAAIYYLDHFDKLSAMIRRQFIFIMVAVVAIVLVLSNWGHKIV